MDLLLIVFLFSVGIGFLLIFFLKKIPKKMPGEIEIELPESLKHLNFDQFFALSCRIIEQLGLQIKESYRDNDKEADIYADNPTPLIGGPVIVHIHLYPEEGRVNSMDVMNFASNLVGERRGKGIYLTTGHFGADVWTLPELPPMDFIDGNKLEDLLKQYQIV